MDRPSLRLYRVGDSLDERIRILRELCWGKENGIQNPQTLFIARRITQNCIARDAICELRNIHRFVIENVRYTGDIAGVDTFSAPIRTLQMGGEDCDGHAVLCAALAICNGFRAKVRITSNKGVTWDHIYCMAGLPKGRTDQWIALDTTLARTMNHFSRFGIEPPRVKYEDFSMDASL